MEHVGRETNTNYNTIVSTCSTIDIVIVCSITWNSKIL